MGALKLNLRGTLALGLCSLIAACGVEQQPGDEVNARSEALIAAEQPEMPEPIEASENDPGSSEYELTKAALVRLDREVEAPPPAPQFSIQVANAIVNDPGCNARVLPRNDDGSTSRITLPFSINFFGATYSSLFINNNGNVTFNSPMATYTPFTINARTPPIIAPFFADVDTRNTASGVVTYSNAPITFEGRPAFCVNWVNVGYYAAHADKLNSFQLLLVDRNDTGVGNFDIVMNHNKILWETGDASGGSGGFGGTPAGAGFSAGNGDPAAFFQFPGSLVRSAFLDGNATTGLSRTSHFSNVIGRHIFGVRAGQPVVDERISLSPASATKDPGQSHTVTATLINDRSQPLPNRAVTFRIVSGPSSSLPPTTVNTNAAGQASFTYTSSTTGLDTIRASFTKSTGVVATSDPATVTWQQTARPPVALCQSATVLAGQTCGVAASINNGSYDPDGNLASCTQNPGPIYGLGPTLVTLTCTDTTGLSSSCTAMVTVVDQIAPVISCPADQTAECTNNAATVTLGAASATDNCGSVSVSNPGTASYPLGTTPVSYTATDSSGNASICTARVTVADTLPPSVTLNGSASQTLECGASTYVEAGASAADQCAGNVSGTIAIYGSVDTGTVGVYNLAYTATDPAGHVSSPAFRTVTVADTTPPQVSVGSTAQIWPPNHSMWSFQLSDCASVSDTCGGSLDINAAGRITSISSDEPEDADGNGDGRTTGDIAITGRSSFQIRAEREGRGNGRVYGVNFTVTDASGNTQTATCHFAVPHDQSGDAAVDDGAGAGYTVSASSNSSLAGLRR